MYMGKKFTTENAAFACVHGEENILRQKVKIHPLYLVVDTLCYIFPVVDILCYNSWLLYTVPILVAILGLCY